MLSLTHYLLCMTRRRSARGAKRESVGGGGGDLDHHRLDHSSKRGCGRQRTHEVCIGRSTGKCVLTTPNDENPYYCSYYTVGSPKPEAIGHTRRASAATTTIVCSLSLTSQRTLPAPISSGKLVVLFQASCYLVVVRSIEASACYIKKCA